METEPVQDNPEVCLKTVVEPKVIDESVIKSRRLTQNFHQLRQQCLDEGRLFEDPEFPASDVALVISEKSDRLIEWKRPKDLVDDPQLFVDGFSRFDVEQGELGDCWMLSPLANLTMNPNLFCKIIPRDQGFGENYAGIFHFRFWQYGKWVDVVVDDRLPLLDGQLLNLKSGTSNEFWTPLLEKAYAKLHGCYECLKGGSALEAMVDLTGGVAETIVMANAPPDLFDILLKAYERNSLMGCSVEADPHIVELRMPSGLIKGHAYSITKVKVIDIVEHGDTKPLQLLRIRNPWGNEDEWNGDWSDYSLSWRKVPADVKKKLCLTFDTDGEFWMCYEDFKKEFAHIEICNLNPDSLTEDDLNVGKKKWKTSMFEGEWVKGVTAGGCRNYLETFSSNPQYRITLEHPDEGDDKCTVIIALMQKHRRAMRKIGASTLAIGFAVYRLKNPDELPKPLDTNFFKNHRVAVPNCLFTNMREITHRAKLRPGVYCIVPSAFEPSEEGEFLLRIFTENKHSMEENDEKVGVGEVDERVQPVPSGNEEKIHGFFKRLAGDDMEIDCTELKAILDYAMRKEMQDQGFNEDICQSIIAMLDKDSTEKLNFEEFTSLWNDIRMWRAAFHLHDKDGSGNLSAFELRRALNSAGYRLNNRVLNILVRRYGTEEGTISFDNYIMCAVQLKTLIGKEMPEYDLADLLDSGNPDVSGDDCS